MSEPDGAARRHAHLELDSATIAKLLAPIRRGARVLEAEPLAGGYINTNYRVRLEGLDEWLVVRVFTRDAVACQKELDLYDLVRERVPVAEILFGDPDARHFGTPYLVARWVEGVKLEDLIARGACDSAAAYDVGRVLANISAFEFEESGFFGPRLTIPRPFADGLAWFAPYVEEALLHGAAGRRLGEETARQVLNLVEDNAELIEATPQIRSLVHADYRSWNLLMNERDGKLRVAAVLDWEFAFSGPPLLDIGGLLRHSESLPADFEPDFIRGFSENGGQLPPEWKKTARLLDLINLCQFLSVPDKSDWRVAVGRDCVRSTLERWGRE